MSLFLLKVPKNKDIQQRTSFKLSRFLMLTVALQENAYVSMFGVLPSTFSRGIANIGNPTPELT